MGLILFCGGSMSERRGWLLDLYAGSDPASGMVLWLLDDRGERVRLQHAFPLTFYASGPPQRLRALWRYLESQPEQPALARAERRDLFSEHPITVLAAQVAGPTVLARLFWRTAEAFPDLSFYDADIPPPVRYAAHHGVFPLARCSVDVDEDGQVQQITALDSPWDLDPEMPPLRILTLHPDCDPNHAEPQYVLARFERYAYRLPLEPARALLINLRALLSRHDPDLLLTAWGDTWLLPLLLDLAETWKIPMPFNRDSDQPLSFRPERSYFSYGQVIYRGQQVHLAGRWHLDSLNAVFYQEYGLHGILELARVTALPVQTAARVSPGTGISSMQIVTALRWGVLVPWHKQQAERPKTALELVHADQGGLVYQPTIGLHGNVAEIDFISMYPSVMQRFNISPETAGMQRPTSETAPELELTMDDGPPGLVPETLKPLLDKRLELKTRLASLSRHDVRHQVYKGRASAHKWLLVCCFGYLGYKNSRFGRIEAHEAVTAYGREALLRAKEAAEDLGFTVLHMYVDGLWVHRPDAAEVADIQPVLDEIVARTGLPVALEGIYRWVAFLPSRHDKRVPAANRYFGVFRDGTIKVRGVEMRRHDTPPFVLDAQDQLLKLMARYEAGEIRACLPKAVALLRRRLALLRAGRVPLRELLVSQTLSRNLEEYRSPSPAARAAAQLAEVGKELRPGQRVRFIYTLGEPDVYAWDLPGELDPNRVDIQRYRTLLLRAAFTVLEPLGMTEHGLNGRLAGGWQLPARVLLKGDS